jgi:uncharacterized caspase-like protein
MPKPAPKKVALLIGVSEYKAGLPPLPAAPNDVEAMQRVLQDPNMGGFDVVERLLNPDPFAMQDAIERLFAECQKDDLALLFFSGHGITDDNGRLFLTTHLTNEKRFRATSVPASFVHDVMNESSCQRQVVILDCCYSGAFKEGWQSRSAGTIDIKQQLALGSKGRAVLTSSNAVQKSFEHDGSGIYTRYLVEGIETGVADCNGNGTISIQELHEYAKEKVQEAKPAMTPEIHTHKEGFNILLAQARRKPEADYRKLVERYASHGEISFVAREILQQKQKEIGITDGLAAEIENQVIEPYRKRFKNLERYREALKDAVEYRYPLAQKTRDELKDLQDVFGLRDEDVEPIQEQITADKEGVDYTKLRDLLAQGKWRQADGETLDVMLKVAGREQQGYLRDYDIEEFPCTDLRTIDTLWVKYSKGRFGFSVQKRIWESVGGTPNADLETFSRFCDRLKWRVNNDWQEYDSLTFSCEKAALGHLPAQSGLIGWMGSDYKGIFSRASGVLSWKPRRDFFRCSLAWTLEKCNI